METLRHLAGLRNFQPQKLIAFAILARAGFEKPAEQVRSIPILKFF